MENQTNNALALRMNQANEIKQVVSCFIPETSENQAIFAKNCLFYLVKNKAQMNDGNVVINGISVDMFEFCQKMYLASKVGLSLIDGEFSFITYDGGEVVVVPDFRAEKRIAEEKGLTIAFVHGRQGDEFTEDANPLKHSFKIQQRKGTFAKIESKTATSRNGKQYSVNEVQNDILWYAAVAKVNETGEEFSYVESTENILLRANPKTLKFYRDPNAMHAMFEKFVLRQLIKRLPSNLRGIDFDKWEGKFEDVEDAQIVEEMPKKEPKPIEKTKIMLVRDSEVWSKMEKAIKDGKVKDIASIERKYDIAAEDRNDILNMLMEATESSDEATESPMNI